MDTATHLFILCAAISLLLLVLLRIQVRLTIQRFESSVNADSSAQRIEELGEFEKWMKEVRHPAYLEMQRRIDGWHQRNRQRRH